MSDITTTGSGHENYVKVHAHTEDTKSAVVALAVTVGVVVGSYYVVRRGIDRRVAKQLKKHLKEK